MGSFQVELKKWVDDSYEIEIGYELEDKLISDLKHGLVGNITKFAVITDSNVKELYAERIHDKLKEAGFTADLFVFEAGETQKTRETKEFVEDSMLEKGYRRDCCIIAVGGGVVTDLSGFVAGTFDGLRKLLAGTQNEITCKTALTTSQELDEHYNAFLDEMDAFLSCLDGAPSMLLMNRAMLIKLRSIARRAGYYERTKDDFGHTVETYAGIPMVDMGKYFDGENVVDVIPTEGGKTAIYAVCLGLDGFHGISPMGDGVINSYMPDMTTPGAVKTGEVELVAGVALKNTLKAAVLRDIAIAAA